MIEPSYGSVFTCIVFGSILMLYLIIISKHTNFIRRYGANIIIVCTLIITVRMFFPCNFIFTHNIQSKVLLAAFFDMIKVPIFMNITLMDIMIYGSLSGFMICFLRFTWRTHRFHQLIHIYPYLNDHTVNEIITCICKKYKKKQNIKIVCLPQIKTPCITGLCHPTILLPDIAFTSKELEFILKHEFEHYYHHDLWIKFIFEILRCFYWWNPLVYWIQNQLNHSLELSNDSTIAKDMNEYERLCYVECLMKIAKYEPSAESVPVLCFFERSQSSFLQRAAFILEPPHISSKKMVYSTHIFGVAVIMFLSMFFSFEPCYPTPPHEKGEVILGFEKKDTFFVKNGKTYDIYYKGKKYPPMEADSLKSSFSGYRVYQSKQEALKHEKIK